MPNEEGMKVLDVRLANVEEAIMEMKESQQKIGDALTELVRLASRHEEHRTHIEKRIGSAYPILLSCVNNVKQE